MMLNIDDARAILQASSVATLVDVDKLSIIATWSDGGFPAGATDRDGVVRSLTLTVPATEAGARDGLWKLHDIAIAERLHDRCLRG